jgi:hypothetical protein
MRLFVYDLIGCGDLSSVPRARMGVANGLSRNVQLLGEFDSNASL